MKLQSFFDKNTATFSYVVADETTKQCAIIDSVLDYDPQSGRVVSDSAKAIIEYVQKQQYQVQWILETHVHADHLTAAHILKQALGGQTGIGEHVKDVLEYWVPLYNMTENTPLDASQFDHVFKDGETFQIGEIKVEVIHTPGHTPACVCYKMENKVFVGDTLLMPHIGTARVDFPGGSAAKLYDSIQTILALPDETEIYVCHDYPQADQAPSPMATVADHKQFNKMVKDGTDAETYIKIRETKDKTMAVPKLLLPAIQVNLRSGVLPDQESNGIQYLKIPLNQF